MLLLSCTEITSFVPVNLGGYTCNGQQQDEPCDCTDNDNDGYGEGVDCIGADCDDEKSSVHPDAPEYCDGIDNDCDDEIDEDLDLFVYYEDSDGDAFGDPNNPYETCESSPEGYVTNNLDCDDTDEEVSPAAEEICDNGIDDDCNGYIDDQVRGCPLDLDCIDNDGDEYGEGEDCLGTDCNDEDSDIYETIPCLVFNNSIAECSEEQICDLECPENISEICDSGFDEDCDELIDEDDPDCPIVAPECTDNDGDGFYIEEEDCGAIDCDDDDPDIHPDAEEICDEIDNNCDDNIDDVDNDDDGFIAEACEGDDCDDNNVALNLTISCQVYNESSEECEEQQICDTTCPTNPVEICGNDIDEDCDNLIDDADPECPTETYTCANPHSDWLFCEDWENHPRVNIIEKECARANYLECQDSKWSDWYSLGAYNRPIEEPSSIPAGYPGWGDLGPDYLLYYDGVRNHTSNSGENSLQIINDPYCHCPCSDGTCPNTGCGDFPAFPCDQTNGGCASSLLGTFNEPENNPIYARTYIKWSENYNCNWGNTSTGKGFYLSGYGLNFQFRKGDTWHYGGDYWNWGSFPNETQAFAVITYYNNESDNLFGDCPGDECRLIHGVLEEGGDCPEGQICEALPCDYFMDNRWHSIEYMAKKDDQTIALWIDGTKRFEFTNLEHEFSFSNKVKITNHYHGGPPHLQGMHWDDIVVSTSYIGPTKCISGEEIAATCYCGGAPNPDNNSNIYNSGFCCDETWSETECE